MVKLKRISPHQDMVQEYYDALIPALRLVARRYGYALGVHGSLKFDIDIIAAPWREHCATPQSLADAILNVCKAVIGDSVVSYPTEKFLPTQMPCGRLAWSIYLVPIKDRSPYIDLSIMPVGSSDTKSKEENLSE